MFKKLNSAALIITAGLLVGTGISSTAHALTAEQFKELADGTYRNATTMYLGGVNDAVRIFNTWSSDEDCAKWKVLSPNQIMAAFEAHYDDMEDKQQLIAVWAFSYSLKNGGCADE